MLTRWIGRASLIEDKEKGTWTVVVKEEKEWTASRLLAGSRRGKRPRELNWTPRVRSAHHVTTPSTASIERRSVRKCHTEWIQSLGGLLQESCQSSLNG